MHVNIMRLLFEIFFHIKHELQVISGGKIKRLTLLYYITV